MATVKLGLNGSEVTLASSLKISLPVTYSMQKTRVEMSDGSRRWGNRKKFRIWSLAWSKLTKTELDSLITLCDLDSTLRFQNNYESSTWKDVVITDFSYDSVDPISTTKYYFASMTIEEDN